MRLSPCLACTRLVRYADSTCPFCRAAVTHVTSAQIPRRIHRAALLGAVAVAAACGGETITPVYGSPIVPDAGLDATDAARDSGPDAVMGAYGLPPMDASADSSDGAAADAADSGND
ncbi:hypothetical protein BH09MYX1_BH09MYX1_67180 [soil metagenome]